MRDNQLNRIEIPFESYQSYQNHVQFVKADPLPYRYVDNICWFYPPHRKWQLSWYTTVRGAENFHIYIWILKDLAWAQSWYVAGHVFGIFAIVWALYLFSHAVRLQNINEMWASFAQFLWLSANMWWMSSDLHDQRYPDAPKIYPRCTIEAGYMMEAAMLFLAVYYLVIKPFKIFQPTRETELKYDDTVLSCRFPSVFRTWREYENVHILFWLGKDHAWNTLNPYTWVLFVIPTFLVAADFACNTLFNKDMIVEHAHYLALLLWVCGNMLWAMGEIFDPAHDTPFDLLLVDATPEAFVTLRWYSSWVLVSAYTSIIVMYLMWARAYRNTANSNNWETIRDDCLTVIKQTASCADLSCEGSQFDTGLGPLDHSSPHPEYVAVPDDLML